MKDFHDPGPSATPPSRGGLIRFLIKVFILIAAVGLGMMVYNTQHFASNLTGEGSIGSSISAGSSGGGQGLQGLGGASHPGLGAVGGLGKVGTGGGMFGGSPGGGSSGGSLMSSGPSDSELAANREKEANTDALLEAASKGDQKTVEKLLGKRVAPDGRDNDDRTSLMFAAWSGQNAICNDLLAAGARIALADRYGNTALDYAAGSGRVDTVQLLLAQGGISDTKHYREYAQLVEAAYSNDASKLPEGRLASVNRLNIMGEAPLHIAAASGNEAAAKELLRHGADKTLPDRQGQTASAIARSHSFESLAILLR